MKGSRRQFWQWRKFVNRDTPFVPEGYGRSKEFKEKVGDGCIYKRVVTSLVSVGSEGPEAVLGSVSKTNNEVWLNLPDITFAYFLIFLKLMELYNGKDLLYQYWILLRHSWNDVHPVIYVQSTGICEPVWVWFHSSSFPWDDSIWRRLYRVLQSKKDHRYGSSSWEGVTETWTYILNDTGHSVLFYTVVMRDTDVWHRTDGRTTGIFVVSRTFVSVG